MRGRVFDPKVGRFLTTDPIVSDLYFGQAFNPYSYVLGNPLTLVDPSGFQPIDAANEPGVMVFPDAHIKGSYGGQVARYLNHEGPPPREEPPPKEKEDARQAGEVGAAAPPTDVDTTGSSPEIDPQASTTAPEDWTQNPYVQIEGGFLAGISLGLVPLGGVGQQLADAGELLPHGTPEARLGLAVGMIVGGIATTAGGVAGGLLGGAATATGAGAPVGVPAMVVSTTLVVGGALNVAAGIRGLTQALSTGGGSGAVNANRYVNPKVLRPTHRPDSNAKIDKYAKIMLKKGFDPSDPIRAVEIDGALYIENGHHRAAAAAKAGIREVPVIVRSPRSPEEAAEIIRDAISTLDDRF